MELGVLNYLAPLLWQLLRYWRSEANILFSGVTFIEKDVEVHQTNTRGVVSVGIMSSLWKLSIKCVNDVCEHLSEMVPARLHDMRAPLIISVTWQYPITWWERPSQSPPFLHHPPLDSDRYLIKRPASVFISNFYLLKMSIKESSRASSSRKVVRPPPIELPYLVPQRWSSRSP